MSVVPKALWVIFCLQIAPLIIGQQLRDESSRGLSVAGVVQNEFTRIDGPEDRDIPLPLIEDASHPKNPSAIQELIEYLNAVGLKEWKGMQAKGVLLQSNGDEGIARLTIGTGDQTRLDVMTASGTTSTRMDGNVGMTIHPDGKRVGTIYLTPFTGLKKRVNTMAIVQRWFDVMLRNSPYFSQRIASLVRSDQLSSILEEHSRQSSIATGERVNLQFRSLGGKERLSSRHS